jgi:hypothetical protein
VLPDTPLNFASDANDTLWTSAGIVEPGVLGWLNRKMHEETGDEVKSQGWPRSCSTPMGTAGGTNG